MATSFLRRLGHAMQAHGLGMTRRDARSCLIPGPDHSPETCSQQLATRDDTLHQMGIFAFLLFDSFWVLLFMQSHSQNQSLIDVIVSADKLFAERVLCRIRPMHTKLSSAVERSSIMPISAFTRFLPWTDSSVAQAICFALLTRPVACPLRLRCHCFWS